MVAKKSKYKSVTIKKKRYYFYKITWSISQEIAGTHHLHTALGLHAISYDNAWYLFDQIIKISERLVRMKTTMNCFRIGMFFHVDVLLKMEKVLL